MKGEHRKGKSRGRRMACLVMTASAVAACGSSSAPRTVSTSSSTSTTGSAQQQVLDGYKTAVQAIADAELHNDPQWPALLASVVNPELSHVQAFIATEVHLGYHSQGSIRLIRADVITSGPTQAIVKACVYGGVVAYKADGTPVPGNAGRTTYDVAQGTLVPAGSMWVLENGTDQQYSTAQQAGPICAA